MTREEAINMLKNKMDGHTDTSYEWVETVRMAIKALEQEPYSDIEAIYNAGYKDGKHDGYYSTLIANGGEPEHYGRGLVEISEDKE